MAIDAIHFLLLPAAKVAFIAVPSLLMVERGSDASATNLNRWLSWGFIGLSTVVFAGWYLPPLAITVYSEWFVSFAHVQSTPASMEAPVATAFSLLLGSGVLWHLAGMVHGQLQLIRLKKSASTCAHPAITAQLKHAKNQLNIAHTVRCVLSPDCITPLTWGTFQPVIALPLNAMHWPEERSYRVLLHELAHIKRKDALFNGLIRLTATIFWWVPGKRFLLKKIHWYRELACDDLVLAQGVHRADYAGDLMIFALNAPRTPGHAVAIMALSDHYLRINSVLSEARDTKLRPAYWPAVLLWVFFITLGAVQIKPENRATNIVSYPIQAAQAQAPERAQVPPIETHAIKKPVRPNGTEVPAMPTQMASSLDTDVAGRSLKLEGTIAERPAATLYTLEAPLAVIKQITPQYPRSALKKGIEGNVTAQFDVNERGEVNNIRLRKPHSNGALNKAVINALQQTRYQPRTLWGQPVATKDVTEIYQFQIYEDAK